jgi:hypothetical protein
MTSSKKPTPDEKHKVVGHKATKPVAGRTMDIIPKNRIRPSTTSRPVITNGPLVADNTMTGPSTAPTLNVKRHHMVIDPSKDFDPSKDNASPDLITVTPDSDSKPQPAAVSQGVSVEELIAKRSGGEKVIEAPVAETLDETENADASSVSETPVEAGQPKNPWEEFNDDTTSTQEPAVEASSADDNAAAEAARLLSHPPHSSIAELEATHSSSRRGSTDEAAIETKTSTPEDTSLIESRHQDKPAEQPADTGDSLADILREEPTQTQEHSQALKDAMKEIDQKGQKHDHEEHHAVDKQDSRHDLYGGQPVIVVHKDHGQMSPMAWVLWFVFCLLLAMTIVNFLLDAGYIETNYEVPHTNLIGD